MDPLVSALFNSLIMLIKLDDDLINSQPKEECINHRLAYYLENELCHEGLLNDCSVDIEYNKHLCDQKKMSHGSNIRPDIIVHKRRSGNINNLIVIEAKKNYATKHDLSKIKELVLSNEYKYSIGAAISYMPNKEYVIVKILEQSGNWLKYKLFKSDYQIKAS